MGTVDFHGQCFEVVGVDDMQTPALVVPQMFGGAQVCGGVGLYVDNGTHSLFRNLRIMRA